MRISFGEPIDARKIALDETNDESAYEKVTRVLKQRIQQMFDETREERMTNEALNSSD